MKVLRELIELMTIILIAWLIFVGAPLALFWWIGVSLGAL
jgi:hypothetical protein